MAIHTEVRGGDYKRGLAEVRVKEGNLMVKFDESDEIFKVDYLPEEIGTIPDGRYRVTLSGSGDKIYGIAPETGTYIVRYNGMVAKEGQLPSPFVVQGGKRTRKDGKGTWDAPDYMAFTVLLRVLSTTHKKINLPIQLTYSFEQYKDTNETLIPLGRTQFEKTSKFLTLAGLDYNTDVIPYSENVLPFLDELFRKRNTKFQIEMKKGYVDSMFPLAAELDED